MYTVEYSHRFKYRPITEQNLKGPHTANLPAIELILKSGGVECPVLALIDTGAEYSLFSAEIAEVFGISLFDGRRQPLSSLGGKITGYAHTVNIEIAYGWSLGPMEILFADRNIGRNLIGRTDFLLRVQLGLSELSETIYLFDVSRDVAQRPS